MLCTLCHLAQNIKESQEQWPSRSPATAESCLGPHWGDVVLRVGLMLILGAGMGGAWYILGNYNRTACQVGSGSKLLRSDGYQPTLRPQHSVDTPPGCPGGS